MVRNLELDNLCKTNKKAKYAYMRGQTKVSLGAELSSRLAMDAMKIDSFIRSAIFQEELGNRDILASWNRIKEVYFGD